VPAQTSKRHGFVNPAETDGRQVKLMDIPMSEMDGMEATRIIKAEMPQINVIGLSMYEDEHVVIAMRKYRHPTYPILTLPAGSSKSCLN
jgi:DNA-binding NarL/FixJ family response regulator